LGQNVLEGLHQGLTVLVLFESDRTSQEHNENNDNGEIVIGRIRGIDTESEPAEALPCPHHECETICDLMEEFYPSGSTFFLREFIQTILMEVEVCLLSCEPFV